MHQHGDHHHGVGSGDSRTRLRWAMGLTLLFALVEAIGGFWTGSLALLADALHMVADSAAMLIALLAVAVSQRPHTRHATFGYHRAEVLAALVNAGALGAIVLRLGWEAIERLLTPTAVSGGPMTAIAALGLIINLVTLLLLKSGVHKTHDSINLRAAAAHVAGDLLGSAAAILAGIAVIGWGWTIADPIASLAVSILVGYSAWRLLKESTTVLLDLAPAQLNVAALERDLASLPGVRAVSDLHVWQIVPGRVALAGHLLVVDPSPIGEQQLLQQARALLEQRYGIRHSTLQFDRTTAGERLPALN